MQWEIIASGPEIIEYIDNTLGHFNKTQVNYNSKMDYLPLNFHIKDETGNIIAGINAFACWQMLWLNELYVDSTLASLINELSKLQKTTSTTFH